MLQVIPDFELSYLEVCDGSPSRLMSIAEFVDILLRATLLSPCSAFLSLESGGLGDTSRDEVSPTFSTRRFGILFDKVQTRRAPATES